MLAAIGLDDVHESAYRALVAVGAAEVPELSRRLMLGEYATERALRRLERHGLAAQSSARPGRWVAAPPGAALGALLNQHRQDLERAEHTAALLAEEFRARAAEPAAHDLVEIVTGAGAVAQRFAQIRLGAAHEFCALVTAPAVTASAGRAGVRGTSSPRGVEQRVVMERAVLSLPVGLTELSAALGREEQVRITDRVPARLVIADRSLGMVPLTPRAAEPAALVVHGSGLLDSLLALFESVWSEALPLRLGQGGQVQELQAQGPDETDLEILSLLLAGLTDASVAKQLDLGLRTVQRRVKRLMELTGVTTRLQLGWHAYERNWVARVPRQPSPSSRS